MLLFTIVQVLINMIFKKEADFIIMERILDKFYLVNKHLNLS